VLEYGVVIVVKVTNTLEEGAVMDGWVVASVKEILPIDSRDPNW